MRDRQPFRLFEKSRYDIWIRQRLRPARMLIDVELCLFSFGRECLSATSLRGANSRKNVVTCLAGFHSVLRVER
jgi:hypothetical protein